MKDIILKVLIFIKGLFSDKSGIPDEAAVAFFIALIVLTIGSFLKAFGYAFPLINYATAIGTIIPLYKLTRGDWRD